MRYITPLLAFALAFSHSAFAQTSTWETIQSGIFDAQCVQCHVAGSAFATQSGLILTSDVAYDNLIDVTPTNSTAAGDGLVRVSSEGGLAAPHQSFLWEKINAPNQDHFYADHPAYGSLMPLGLPPLTNGEINYIQAWIEAGAPENGAVVDPALLNDKTRYEPPDFKPLDPPAQGIQFRLGPFDVWSAERHDREFLYYEPYPTDSDMYVSGYEISMRPGSHHFILYHYGNDDTAPVAQTYRDIREPDGSYNAPPLLQLNFLFPFRFMIGTQTPYIRFQFPEGIALRVPSGKGFDLNSHSVNRSGQTQVGEVYTNIYTVDESEVQLVATPDNFSNEDILLPPNQETVVSREFTFRETRHLLQIWAHAHEHMTEFRIEGVGGEHDGELLYWTNDWEHPPLLHLDPPLTFNAGDAVRLKTTYNNTTDNTIRYGLLSSDEMQFMFYMYVTGELPTASEEDGEFASSFRLAQNYPNPFTSQTTIEYYLPEVSKVRVRIYDMTGKEVTLLRNRIEAPGTHRLEWDGSRLPSGVYAVVLEAGEEMVSRLAFLVK